MIGLTTLIERPQGWRTAARAASWRAACQRQSRRVVCDDGNTMTDLLSRPILRVNSADDEPIRPIAISAAVASCWVAAVGLLVCIVTSVVAWFSASSGRFGSAVEVGALAWLVGNGSGVHLGDVTVTAMPVGFLAVVCWMLYRSGRWAGANSVVRSGADAAFGAAVM